MKGKQAKITGVVLAGGRARRMSGEDKGLIPLNDRPLITYVLGALKPCVDQLLINANRNQKEYEKFGIPVISDETTGFDGPLAGILAAMKISQTDALITVPCDTPMLQERMVQRMINTMRNHKAEIYVAHDGNRLQPVFLGLDCKLKKSLERYLDSGNRKIDIWLNQHVMKVIDYTDCPEMFININSPDELANIEQVLMEKGLPGK
ncbi:MAG: molybdenum cofactor guanylyltransferase MobA [Methylococcales bacterium]